MNRIELVAGLCFLAFSGAVMVASRSMEYISSLGPGPGFFPFWLGLLMALLSVIWIAQTLLAGRRAAANAAAAAAGAPFLPQGDGAWRVLAIVGALAAIAALMDTIGFKLAMFAFLVFLLTALGRVRHWLTIVIALAGSVGLFVVFTNGLDVRLPTAAWPWLAALGL